jgi:cellobiose transport system substrate-binding protein
MASFSGTRAVRLGALLAALALVAAACSGDGDVAEAGGDGNEKVTLTMALFGDFGYEGLIKDYEADHPNVKIRQKIAEFNEHHDSLTTSLAAGSGAPDIAAVEVAYMSSFLAQPQNFVNLLDYGAGDLEGDYLDWKWQQALTPDGSALIGLPTDVGGMAMCYRRDLFKKAGLPADRDEVSALWPTWEDFIAVGKQFTEETGTPFTDESSQIFNGVVNQSDQRFYEEDGTLIYDTNPQVQKAWDVATEVSTSGVAANIEPFANEWNKGMNTGSFAVLTCPAWMMGYIQGQAPDTKGQWDIADMPEGGGNWGGSHLAIPAQTEHAEEAYEFISWLLAPEQQLRVFQENGNFPSAPALYDTAEIQEFSNPFFNNAPVGPIFAESAQALEPVYAGPQDGAIRLALENGLDRVDDGNESPAEAWSSAVEEIKLEVGE